MRFILDNSLLLLAGTLTAMIWANLDLSSYGQVAHYLHFAANDVGMVFFFALAAKEVFEATLPGGPLASPPAQRRTPSRRRSPKRMGEAIVSVVVAGDRGDRSGEQRM